MSYPLPRNFVSSHLLPQVVGVWLLLTFLCAGSVFAAGDVAFETLQQQYLEQIHPLLKQFCLDCHSTDKAEGELDLQRFAALTDVRRDPKAWQKVAEMLDNNEMPPADNDQPSITERTRLRAWIESYLDAEALANAGDPGPIVLRRLSNAEYNYTIQDLTGVESLDPTREFPVDGAAGEGFTNTGNSQGMSPSLVQKYLDAAKEVAGHAVLLPDGIRFSPYTTRRDHTDELLAAIQSFYRRFTEDGGGSAVDLQGIKFDTNQGGMLPIERYLEATLVERETLTSGLKMPDTVARERALSARYLATIWRVLNNESKDNSSLFLDALRDKWRNTPADGAAALAAEIAEAQKSLWKFNPVGQVGRESGSKAWMEPVTPITTRHEFRMKLPEARRGSEIVLYLAASDLGDGNDCDFVVWENARIEFTSIGRNQQIPLRDVSALTQRIRESIVSELRRTEQYLDAVRELRSSSDSIETLATAKTLNPRMLESWAEFVGLGSRTKREVPGLFTDKLVRGQGYDAINGWGSGATPSLLTNSSKEPISFLTLTVPARGVTVHPSPTLESIVAWRSPLDGKVTIEGLVADADDKCGNGTAWRVEMLSTAGVAPLDSGVLDNGGAARFKPDGEFDVKRGDIVSLIVNPRDGSHACDTTHVELKLVEVGGKKRVWDLAPDIVDNVLSGNPLPDAYGNERVWHFAASESTPQIESSIPPGSTLATWRAAVIDGKPASEINQFAQAVQVVVTAADADSLGDFDKQLYYQVTDWKGPLRWVTSSEETAFDANAGFGLDPAQFGRHPNGSLIDAASLCLQAPRVIEVRLPAELASGAEFVTTGSLHAETGKEGSVQLHVLTTKPDAPPVSLAVPILVSEGSEAQQRVSAAMHEFRTLFPAALCYARIVPVDEVVTLTLFHREDHHLKRLMLDDLQAAELDRLWDELYYVSQEPLKLVVALEQITQFATQDRQDLVPQFEALKDPIGRRAVKFSQRLVETQPAHVKDVLEFADRAWCRPLTEAEQQSLRHLYQQLRETELPHEDAIRLTLARVLTSPAFLYRREKPASGTTPSPVSDIELASRLSHFLWSSLPDDELRRAAQAGRLHDEEILVTQTQRMLEDPRTRRLAVQFACQWLHVRNFDRDAEKNEKLYPDFAELRDDMYEETVRFFEDMFRHNRSILNMLDAEYTFVNEALAKHYGIHGPSGSEWQRVEQVQVNGRGGLLGMATILASQSGASRTSPILRGNWVYETLLGERLPRPPAGVPVLPDEPPQGLTARKLIEQHSSVEACAKCHLKIDPFGFALEQYDAIGRLRPVAVDTTTTLAEGQTIDGIEGLRAYLLTDRRDDVMRQFCRKLLGYALGREIQLSDRPLLDRMIRELEKNDYRFSVAVESIVRSDQFRKIRGAE
ncbi:MAG: DUF1592 domain-containing protein [Planctomycetaceae bacterium]|nr:DUF1592 domain-containing protein [Planctomycetales bacterium]MCB9921983.1 DUF1592 domain-containing protein [Planctomycetaceae bacterium]